jgi:hypothetical protein
MERQFARSPGEEIVPKPPSEVGVSEIIAFLPRSSTMPSSASAGSYESKNRSAVPDRSAEGRSKLLHVGQGAMSFSGEAYMRYTFAFVLLFAGPAPSDAVPLLKKIRLAQALTPNVCIANCDAINFACSQNCGLSGACVAQGTADANACKNRSTQR